MTRRAKRWPIWKIAVATAGCLVVAGGLFWVARLVDQPAPTSAPSTPVRTPAVSVATVLLMMAMVAGILGVVSLGWLIVRVREAVTPPWKRRAKRRR